MPVIQITISQGRSIQQKRELIKVLTRETARIMQTQEEKMRILIYEVSKENLGKCWDIGPGYEVKWRNDLLPLFY